MRGFSAKFTKHTTSKKRPEGVNNREEGRWWKRRVFWQLFVWDASRCLCCLAENYVCNDSLVMDGLALSANLFTFKSIIFIHSVIQYWWTTTCCLEASFGNRWDVNSRLPFTALNWKYIISFLDGPFQYNWQHNTYMKMRWTVLVINSVWVRYL